MFNRACTLQINKGIEVNTTIQDWLDVQFHVKYSVNQIYGSANIAICGLGKKNVFSMMKNFTDGVTFQQKDKTILTLSAGYKGGANACVGQIYKGTAWDATVYGSPDLWIRMNCLTQYAQANVTNVVVINQPILLKDACTKICMGLMGCDCLWAVTDPEAMKLKVAKWSSDSIKNSTLPTEIAKEIERIGGGRLKCWVDNSLAMTPVVVADRKSSMKGWEAVKGVCQLSNMKFSCTGKGTFDSLVLGIPQLTVNGIKLNIQMNPNIKRGTMFTVDSNIIPNCKGLTYAVLAYEHKGHLRGNEWITHIEGISLDLDAYLQ